ncbi:hypothetical protein LWI28_000697 [Acer negundo]|uniref:Chromo domain-containing protein n=1 Tax=Acer negundo TaxID=4023 RepID=A0AAD5IBE5_ACENE|nr:hypothetical protein LWI28_000697 [Acer negundo]
MEQPLEQRVESLEKTLESFASGQKELLCQVTEMFDKISTKMEQNTGPRTPEMGENSAAPSQRHGGFAQPVSSLSNILPKNVKLDFPKYDGREDPTSWVCRSEQYFQIHNIPMSDRVTLASFHLDGDAQVWFQLLKQELLYVSWEEFRESLYTRIPIIAEFFILPLEGYDVVMGTQWLRTLGPIQWDFSKLHMTFFLNDRKVTLQGLNSSENRIINSLKMQKATKKQEGIIVQVQQIETVEKVDCAHIPKQVQQILNKYNRVLTKPDQLPPQRTHDHRIPLQHDQGPVSVRPYRYPHFQKAEIERLVEEMLDSGIVRPSNSPYSSPVILRRLGENVQVQSSLPEVNHEEGGMLPIPQAVLDRRQRKGRQEVLIHWHGLSPAEATWEDREAMHAEEVDAVVVVVLEDLKDKGLGKVEVKVGRVVTAVFLASASPHRYGFLSCLRYSRR